jgi:hypothetical protein
MALDLKPQVTIKCITCVANHCQRRFPRVRLKERRSSRGLYTLLQRKANLRDGEKYFTETMYLSLFQSKDEPEGGRLADWGRLLLVFECRY